MKGYPYKHHDQKLLCSLYIPSLLGSTGKSHYKLSYVPAKIVCQQIWDSVGNGQSYNDLAYLCYKVQWNHERK